MADRSAGSPDEAGDANGSAIVQPQPKDQIESDVMSLEDKLDGLAIKDNDNILPAVSSANNDESSKAIEGDKIGLLSSFAIALDPSSDADTEDKVQEELKQKVTEAVIHRQHEVVDTDNGRSEEKDVKKSSPAKPSSSNSTGFSSLWKTIQTRSQSFTQSLPPLSALPISTPQVFRQSPPQQQNPDAKPGDDVTSSSAQTAGNSLLAMRQNLVETSKSSIKALQVKARHLVSQNKRRYQKDGFDLDLSYITDNIIAMGFPAGDMSSGIIGYVEGFYRNHIEDVIKFLETSHPGSYKVYNLCSERLYDASLFQGKLECYPIEDHNCPPLSLLLAFCHSCSEWINGGVGRVCVVHCKAGMGRTGLLVACLLLFNKVLPSAEEAIALFNEKRSVDGKALTLPSQQRYVHYFHQLLTTHNGAIPPSRKCLLRGVRLHKCPYWIRPAFTISDHSGVLFSTRKHTQTRDLLPDDVWRTTPRKGVVVFSLPGQKSVAAVAGEFKLTFHDRHGDFYCWLHTNMMENRLFLQTSQLDDFDKRRLGSPGFQVEVVILDDTSPEDPSPAAASAASASPSGSSAMFSAAASALTALQTFYGTASLAVETGKQQAAPESESIPQVGAQGGSQGPASARKQNDIFSDSDEEDNTKINSGVSQSGPPLSPFPTIPPSPSQAPKSPLGGAPDSPKVPEVPPSPIVDSRYSIASSPQSVPYSTPGKYTPIVEKKFEGEVVPFAPSIPSDFEAIAVAGAADTSLFTFGDEEDFEDE